MTVWLKDSTKVILALIALAVVVNCQLVNTAAAHGFGHGQIMSGPPPHAANEKSQSLLNDVRPANSSELRIFGIALRNSIWDPGSIIQICFMGGDRTLRADIAKMANEWMSNNLSISFDFDNLNDPRLCKDNDGSQIRIGYHDPSVHWSYSSVGKEGLYFAKQNQQTMNLFEFDKTRPSQGVFEREVRHEFGHALGLEHEHQSPTNACIRHFDKPRLYAWFDSQYGWSKPQVDAYVLTVFSGKDYYVTAFDPLSITMYYFDPSVFDAGAAQYCSRFNTAISMGDHEFIEKLYGKANQPAARLSALGLTSGEVRAVIENKKLPLQVRQEIQTKFKSLELTW